MTGTRTLQVPTRAKAQGALARRLWVGGRGGYLTKHACDLRAGEFLDVFSMIFSTSFATSIFDTVLMNFGAFRNGFWAPKPCFSSDFWALFSKLDFPSIFMSIFIGFSSLKTLKIVLPSRRDANFQEIEDQQKLKNQTKINER